MILVDRTDVTITVAQSISDKRWHLIIRNGWLVNSIDLQRIKGRPIVNDIDAYEYAIEHLKTEGNRYVECSRCHAHRGTPCFNLTTGAPAPRPHKSRLTKLGLV